MGLKEKVIVVTGGAGGIGVAICEQLVQEGAVPVIVDRTIVPAAWLAGLKARQPEATCECVELTDADACRDGVQRIVARYGRIDGLVNNAGTNDNVALADGHDAFVASLGRNLIHVYDMTRLCMPHLRQSHGSVVNMASKTALTGQGHTSGYSASKGGVLALTREWAMELAAEGIRVNAVVPAEVMTHRYREWLSEFDQPEAKLRRTLERIPLGMRMTKPEEIADTVVFLLSQRASHVTAQWLHVDGGYVHLDGAST